jgi:hypothetical protein
MQQGSMTRMPMSGANATESSSSMKTGLGTVKGMAGMKSMSQDSDSQGAQRRSPLTRAAFWIGENMELSVLVVAGDFGKISRILVSSITPVTVGDAIRREKLSIGECRSKIEQWMDNYKLNLQSTIFIHS